MKKKLYFIFIFIFVLSIVGCSRTTSTTIEKINPVKPTVVATPVIVAKPVIVPKPIEIAKIPGFDNTTDIKPYGKSIPVLEYHSISYDKGNPICIPIKKFEEQMEYLKENDYYTITLTNLYEYLMNNTPIPKKSVVITFDDGYDNNYTDMFPVLKKHKFKATIFVITSLTDVHSNMLTSKQLVEMDKYGIDIESHTVHHDNLKLISKDNQLKTLIESKKYLEKTLNKTVNFFAYPYGGYNKSAIEAVKEAGYKMAFTTENGWSSKKNGIFSLHRVWISASDSKKVFESKISKPLIE
ncbi:polysaccharide deacetylase family protein [Clostridium estertheticum]|uniref:Polysaccharide deacetylase family protein n=1 Tax=Clostridium estertheticum TaxID=238834 RepID=A0AA47I8I0_9CLOT|nr:polysaccharide deacetylase family protein [Clostridium estertheticum]MBU3153749.1 polysaccharide deacetylase family protein [Clostridium estertheticum]MBU3200231.1 polysaccharide deacetylase family protein [Clostridium estertheticum]WAG61464.1 polysaccharide deacetylase family protein [Clostridium estertheticum]WAG64406.1 polysaccharide deacetylase family protein [Clostridium estertheticum]